MAKYDIPQGPVALSMSGGGSKGARLVGQFDWLWNVGKVRNICYCGGTSTGSLITAKVGALLATGDIKHLTELKNIYTGVVDQNIYDSHIPGLRTLISKTLGDDAALGTDLLIAAINGEVSLWDDTGLKKLINTFMPRGLWTKIIRMGQRARNPIEIAFCVGDLQSGQAKMYSNVTHKDPNVLAAACLASANEPVFMPPVKVDEEVQYGVDGGLVDINPVRFAYESKIVQDRATAVIALSLSAEGAQPTDKKFEDILSVFGRTIDVLLCNTFDGDIRTAQLYNAVLAAHEVMSKEQWLEFKKLLEPNLRAKIDKAIKTYRHIDLIHLFPSKPLNIDGMKFDPKIMKQQMVRGFRDTDKSFKRPKTQ